MGWQQPLLVWNISPLTCHVLSSIQRTLATIVPHVLWMSSGDPIIQPLLLWKECNPFWQNNSKKSHEWEVIKGCPNSTTFPASGGNCLPIHRARFTLSATPIPGSAMQVQNTRQVCLSTPAYSLCYSEAMALVALGGIQSYPYSSQGNTWWLLRAAAFDRYLPLHIICLVPQQTKLYTAVISQV